MKILKISVFALSIAAASGAMAADARLNDLDYVRAHRCAGLAKRLTNDVDQWNAQLKAQRNMRSDYISERADDAFNKARKDAGNEANREALTEELTGPCAALMGAPAAIAAR